MSQDLNDIMQEDGNLKFTVFIHTSINYPGEFYYLREEDMSNYGYALLDKVEIFWKPQTPSEYLPKVIAVLEEKKRQLFVENEEKVSQLEAQIQKLLAITHSS